MKALYNNNDDLNLKPQMPRSSDAEWLPDRSGKHGEGFVRWLLCRICNG